MELEGLHLLVREKIAEGKLPQRAPHRAIGGPGEDGVCRACDEKISKGELAMEPVFQDGTAALKLHVQCFWAWLLEARPVKSAD